jgi:predicted lactoylglutathione lyase
MPVRIAVNLPVESIDRSIEFFTRLGFSIDPMLTNDTTAHLLISDEISTMLVTHEMFRAITGRDIASAQMTAEVVIQLQLDSRQRVDELVNAAVEAGGRADHPVNDQDFLYGRSFVDLDGHMWDAFHVDLSAAAQTAEGGATR